MVSKIFSDSKVAQNKEKENAAGARWILFIPVKGRELRMCGLFARTHRRGFNVKNPPYFIKKGCRIILLAGESRGFTIMILSLIEQKSLSI